MAQDFLLSWISGHLQKQERQKVIAALERMGLRNVPEEWEPLRWEMLDWFVNYAQLDIDALSHRELSEKDEEVQVIQLLSGFDLNPWVPDKEDLKQLQNKVLKILSDLTDLQSTRIGPIPVEFVIWRGQIKQRCMPEGLSHKGAVRIGGLTSLIGLPPAEGVAVQVPPIGMEALLHCLAQLLTKFPSAVRRCRNCSRLFTRFKFKSFREIDSSCSRQCQTRSWAKEQYRKKKQAQEMRKREANGIKRASVRRAASHKKAGKAHGKKRRTR